LCVDRTQAGQERQYVLRLMRRRNDEKIYVVAAGARQASFTRLEPQLRQALDTFRILDFGVRDWP
jgi:hypothetical protein